MSHEERNTFVALFTNILVAGFFALRILQMYQLGQFSGPDVYAVWARFVLWIIPASVVASIVVTVVFNILFAFATNTPKPNFVVDERDKAIGNFGMRVTAIVASAGFILAIVTLAFEGSPFAALNITFFSFAIGDFVGNVAKILRYRRGY